MPQMQRKARFGIAQMDQGFIMRKN